MNRGVLYGAGAYVMWGFFPIYFKALHSVPALQIISHRVIWSFLFLGTIVLASRQAGSLKASVSSWRILGIYSLAAGFLAANWLIYVWAVNAGHVVETSLGYFINPLLNVALGVLLLRERLRPLQWLPVGVAGLGVLYLTLQLGALPWIALALAFTFGTYGLLKKIAPLGSLYGLTLETGILLLPALGVLLFAESQGSGAFGHTGLSGALLLAMAGVLTSIPLLMFASAARLIPLTWMGLLQFIAPTCQLLLGVLVYKEPFTQVELIGFSMIWIALILFTVEGLWQRRSAAPVFE